MIDREAIRQRWRLFGSQLDERGRRHFAVSRITHFEGQVIGLFDGLPAGNSRAL
jgi:hypothetical protein